jgi:hypothetical protein
MPQSSVLPRMRRSQRKPIVAECAPRKEDALGGAATQNAAPWVGSQTINNLDRQLSRVNPALFNGHGGRRCPNAGMMPYRA